jgi:tetratricopeptide (TPR) repeat protein
MKPLFLMFFALTLVSVFPGCASKKEASQDFDRELIDAELAFGRKAAQFELWQEAIFRWEKVRARDGANAKALNNLAVAYEAVGNYDQAKALYEEALDLDESLNPLRNNYKRFLNFYKRKVSKDAQQPDQAKESTPREQAQKPTEEPREETP